MAGESQRVLVVGCGALVREFQQVVRINGLDHVDVECLPASLHNTPDLITAAVVARIERAVTRYGRVFVGYADCGTGGRLDAALERLGVQRLPGAHCYEFFAGSALFSDLHEEEPGTFYLTDYLAKHFDRLVWVGLGLDRGLRDTYFANYRRLVHLSQVPDPELIGAARRAADRLGLGFEHRHVGLGDLETSLVAVTARVAS